MDIGSTWKDWEVIELLGSGSYGKVYRIRRSGFNGFTEESALKVIRIPQDPQDYESALNEGLTMESVDSYFEGVVSELSNEFALMSRLKGNSNIVSYEDYEVEKIEGEFGWKIYIRMEMLTPLTAYIRGRELTGADVAKIGIDICRALEICEQENIIHRDIKAENIFVSAHGDYKLGDFGIAKRMENVLISHTKKGTPSTMAPEVYRGDAYNSKADIYSLGMVLYRLCNNNRDPFIPPYDTKIQFTDRENALMRRMKGDELPDPVNADENVSAVIRKARAYNAEERFADAGSMRRALEAALEGDSGKLTSILEEGGTPAGTAGAVKPAGRGGTASIPAWIAAHKLIAAIATLAIAAAIFFAVGLFEQLQGMLIVRYRRIPVMEDTMRAA